MAQGEAAEHKSGGGNTNIERLKQNQSGIEATESGWPVSRFFFCHQLILALGSEEAFERQENALESFPSIKFKARWPVVFPSLRVRPTCRE